MANNIDIDKYIDWYKNECKQSELKRWLDYELWNIGTLRTQTNFICGTYKNEVNAKKYNDRVNEIYTKRLKEYNNFNQSIYHPREWLIISLKQWETFDKVKDKNQHILELDRLLSLCKETNEAKQKKINDFITKLKLEEITNLESLINASIIQLDFFDKGSYFANENLNFMGYCQEQAFFSLIYDYYKIKALNYANKLLCLIKSNDEIQIIKSSRLVPIDVTFSVQNIEKILTQLNTFLFVNSTTYQWQTLFEEIELKEPITVNVKATKKDIRYFFDELVKLEIISKEYNYKLVNLKAIKHKGKLLNNRTLKDAFQDSKKGFSIIKYEQKINECLNKIR